MGKYRVWIDDNGIIKGWIGGVHNKKDAESIIAEVNTLIENSGFRKVLIDMSKIEKATLDARKVHLDNLNSKPSNFNKLALFGANTLNRVMANFMIRAARLEDKIKFFNSEADALVWLKE